MLAPSQRGRPCRAVARSLQQHLEVVNKQRSGHVTYSELGRSSSRTIAAPRRLHRVEKWFVSFLVPPAPARRARCAAFLGPWAHDGPPPPGP